MLKSLMMVMMMMRVLVMARARHNGESSQTNSVIRLGRNAGASHSKIDKFVPHTQRVNFRIVGQHQGVALTPLSSHR